MNGEDFTAYATRRYEASPTKAMSGDVVGALYASQSGTLAVLCAEMYRRLDPEDQAFIRRLMERVEA